MPYAVTDKCIKCKYTECAEVCPIDCFHEGENMLVIHPGLCIDCAICEPECPVEAIIPGTEENADQWVEFNLKYARQWPIIAYKKEPPEDAKEWRDKEEKMQYFSEKPGVGS